MHKKKRIVIIAGEESGDIHAASIVRELLANNRSLEISGIGGKHMQAAGVHLVSDLARFGVTGLSEVMRYIFVIRKAFIKIKLHLQTQKPDLLLLIDYPGFNLRLAKFAKKTLGLRILYYISPQVWAWKAGRINTIKAYVDKIAVILPFEKTIYEQAKVPVCYVGHPVIAKIPTTYSPKLLCQNLGLPLNKRIIAMLPGSRINEIEKHLTVLFATASLLHLQIPDLHFVIPIANNLDPEKVKAYFKNYDFPLSLISGKALDVIAASNFVVVASGTASLESALLNKPMCIIYKASWLSYIVANKLMKIKYLGICNLLANKMLVPELLQYDCNVQELTRTITELLENQLLSKKMQNHLQQLTTSLATSQADCSIISLINEELYSKIE